MKRYAYSIDLNDENSSWATLIRWTGRDQRVLDVGCGRGQMGRVLHEQWSGIVTGIEINPEFARDCVGYNQVIIGSAEDETLLYQIKDQFDIIICADVLEHLRDPEIPLRAFHRMLAPGGHLLVSVPNVAQFRIRLMLLRGRWDYTPEGIMDSTHLRWFTLSSLYALVTQCGWHATDFAYTVGPNLGRRLKPLTRLKRYIPSTLFAAQFLLCLSPEPVVPGEQR